MAKTITDETMDYISVLAKLELSGEERKQAGRDMEKMLEYIDLLKEVDTTGVEPLFHVLPVENVFREDVVTNGDGSRQVLQNAPAEKGGMFAVPRTFD